MLHFGQAGLRSRCRHGAAGVAKAKADHVVIAGHDGGTGASRCFDQACRYALGTGPGRNPADPGAEPPALAHPGAGRRPDEDWRDVVIGRAVGADDSASPPRRWWLRLHHDAQVPPQHLSGRRGHARPGAAQEIYRPARARGQLLFLLAEEVRQIMAQLGIKKLDDMIGRADLLDRARAIAHWKASGLTSRIFHLPMCRNPSRPPGGRAGPWPGEGIGQQA